MVKCGFVAVGVIWMYWTTEMQMCWVLSGHDNSGKANDTWETSFKTLGSSGTCTNPGTKDKHEGNVIQEITPETCVFSSNHGEAAMVSPYSAVMSSHPQSDTRRIGSQKKIKLER